MYNHKIDILSVPVLHTNPKTSAEQLPIWLMPETVVKIVTILCHVYHHTSHGKPPLIPFKSLVKSNHAYTLWAMKNINNYNWLVDNVSAIVDVLERNHKYSHFADVVFWLECNAPNLPEYHRTTFLGYSYLSNPRQLVENEWTDKIIISHHEYMHTRYGHLLDWGKFTPPHWYVKARCLYKFNQEQAEAIFHQWDKVTVRDINLNLIFN